MELWLVYPIEMIDFRIYLKLYLDNLAQAVGSLSYNLVDGIVGALLILP
jgi:hypothetical protein